MVVIFPHCENELGRFIALSPDNRAFSFTPGRSSKTQVIGTINPTIAVTVIIIIIAINSGTDYVPSSLWRALFVAGGHPGSVK